jgi:hypothetical protein
MLTESPLHLLTAAINDRLSRLRYSFRFLAYAVALAGLLTASGFSPGSRLARAQQLPSDANQFARDVLQHEVESQFEDHALWTYCERRGKDGKQELLRAYQTEKGEIDRLVAVNGQPLTPEQVRAEDQRIRKLISHPGEMRQRQKKQRDDGEQARDLLRSFPDAFQFQYERKQGVLVRLKFSPNLKFDPPNHAAQVFHHLTGTILLDPQQKRLAAIDGTLTSEVKFAGGLFGHLDKGGMFAVHQEEVGPGLWEVTSMHVHMSGKAFFFKTIAVEVVESYSDFRLVPSNTTLSQAAERLKQDSGEISETQAKN